MGIILRFLRNSFTCFKKYINILKEMWGCFQDITIWCVCSHVRPLASQLNNFVVPCGFPDIRPSPIYIISLGFHMIFFLYFANIVWYFLWYIIICGFPDIRPCPIYIISHMVLFSYFVNNFFDFSTFAAS